MALPLFVVTDEADVYRHQQHEDQGLHEPNEHFQKIVTQMGAQMGVDADEDGEDADDYSGFSISLSSDVYNEISKNKNIKH